MNQRLGGTALLEEEESRGRLHRKPLLEQPVNRIAMYIYIISIRQVFGTVQTNMFLPLYQRSPTKQAQTRKEQIEQVIPYPHHKYFP